MRVLVQLLQDDGTVIHECLGNGAGSISASYVVEGGIVLEGAQLRLLGWDWVPSLVPLRSIEVKEG